MAADTQVDAAQQMSSAMHAWLSKMSGEIGVPSTICSKESLDAVGLGSDKKWPTSGGVNEAELVYLTHSSHCDGNTKGETIWADATAAPSSRS